MTATVTRITRDDAKEQARERLTEVLAEVVPGFRPERAFRCLNPDHEDKHPSARYLSRANMVKCFACNWSADVFGVVAAAYGMSMADAFKKTYDILGLDPKSGGYSRPAKPSKPKPKPGTWDEIISLIYPPGWDAPEPEVKLPLPLEVIAEAETGLAGRLALHSDAVKICVEVGLEGWHFDDEALGDFYNAVRQGDSLADYNPDFLDWLTPHATPTHMVRKLARFIVNEGQRRWLDYVFSTAFTRYQNKEPIAEIADNLLRLAGEVTGGAYKHPAPEDTRKWVAEIFTRYGQAKRGFFEYSG